MKLSEIQKLQFQILTGHKGVFFGINERGNIRLELRINIFYNKNLDFIKKHIDEANEYYKNIFAYNFTPAWVETHGLTKPIPEYNKMKELKI